MITTNQLVIEVTRLCNMHCDHCCRGEAQELSIRDDILRFIAIHIKPDCVVFTGGEPSLNIRAISLYFSLAKNHDNLPNSFYVVTNGLSNQRKLAQTLNWAYDMVWDQECCGLAISSDIFHDCVDDDKTEVLRALPFYIAGEKSHPLNEADPKWVLKSGRAAEFGIGYHDPIPSASSFVEWVTGIQMDRDGAIIAETELLYVSANGNIVSSCDLSYEEIDAAPLTTTDTILKEMEEYVLKTKDQCIRAYEKMLRM